MLMRSQVPLMYNLKLCFDTHKIISLTTDEVEGHDMLIILSHSTFMLS